MRTRIVYVASILSVMLPLGGCASAPSTGRVGRSFDDWLSRDRASQDWAGDYDAAERRARATGAPMVFCFTDSKFTLQNATLTALRDERVSARLNDHARATLVRSYEPDRRYAEQFGITRAPSLILVHGDGTFHAYTGVMTPEALVTFLDTATAPGSVVAHNPLIPRTYQYDWMTDLDAATQHAREAQRPMIVAYERHLSNDWRQVSPLLTSREVGLRINGFVHCRVRLLPRTGEAFITPFGALGLPALVVVHPDGRFASMERPESASAVARHIDASFRTGPATDPTSQTP